VTMARGSQTGIPAFASLLLAALAGCAGLVSCASPPPKVEPPRVVAALQAAADVNPDPGGRPSPIALTLYELKSAGRFNNADFFSVFERPDATLTTDLVRKEEVRLAPGEAKVVNLEFREGSRYLGVVAGYRRYEVARWRALVETPPDAVTRVTVRADALAVSITPSER